MNIEGIKKIAFDLMGNKRGYEWRDAGAKYYHGQRAAKLAVTLRKLILPNDDSFDEILTVAAWLHDICNGDDGWADGVNVHGKMGAEKAREILKPFCTSAEIKEIAEMIEYHDDRNLTKRYRSDYLKILQDADLLDHRGTNAVWETIIYAALAGSTARQAAEWNFNKGIPMIEMHRGLVHFEVSKKIFDDKTAFYKEFVERFFAESNGDIFMRKEKAVYLKKASIQDAKAIHEMQIKSFKQLLVKYKDYDTNPAAETLDKIKERFAYDNVDHFFICLQNENIGYIRIQYVDKNTCRISQMCIGPDYQNKGYAQAAIKKIESFYPNAKKWLLDTIKQELKLRHLYEKMGYKLTGVEKNIKEGMDLVYYEK